MQIKIDSHVLFLTFKNSNNGPGPYSKQAFFVGVRVLNDWYVFNKMYYINNLFQMTKTILIPMWNHAFPQYLL